MDWDKFKARFPDAYEALELLAALQPESSPQKINEKLRGAIRGRLGALLGEDEDGDCPDGRYFLKTLWGVEGGSTLKLSQTQGNMLGLWLRGDGNEEKLPGIIDALRVFEGIQASEQISTERSAEAVTEMQRVAQEIGATISEIDEPTNIYDAIDAQGLEDIAQMLESAIEESRSLEGLPEAPASFNFFASIRGFNGQFTLRGWDEGRLLRRAYALIMGLEELGVFPVDRYGTPIVAVTRGTIAEAKAHSAPAQKAAPPPQQPQTTTMTGDYEKFLVKEIEAQIVGTDNDKYVARGGRYMKFGVPVWHEVADQVHGLFNDVHLDDLKIRETWSAAGRNLFALAEKPEGEKFAQKVVEFVVG